MKKIIFVLCLLSLSFISGGPVVQGVHVYGEGLGDLFYCPADTWEVSSREYNGYEIIRWSCGEFVYLSEDYYQPAGLSIVEVAYGNSFETYCPHTQLLVPFPHSYGGYDVPVAQYVCTDNPSYYGSNVYKK